MDLACGRRCRRESYAQRGKLAQGGRREPESRSQTGGRIPRHLAMLRNLAGMAGTGLLSAAALGGAFGWAGPMAYWLATESVLAAHWITPWIWPARTPHEPRRGQLRSAGARRRDRGRHPPRRPRLRPPPRSPVTVVEPDRAGDRRVGAHPAALPVPGVAVWN